ncbi:MAG: hypothetical protein H0X17_19970 [Deltaproteobacteria bacterium]|nr:hypothetical protein [Deltaproteobacteria bacterium]
MAIDRVSPEGVEVYFQDNDSALLSRVTTDASGVAAGPMTAGGFVTVIDPFGHDEATGAQLHTYLDVQPGDAFVLRPPPPARVTTPDRTTTITFPAAADPLVTQYQVFAAGCSIGNYPDTVTEGFVTKRLDLQECEATVDLLVVAFHDAGDLIKVQWGFAADLVIAPMLDLAGLTWSPYTRQTLRFDNLPPSYNRPIAYSTIATKRGLLSGASVAPDGTTQSVQLPLVPGGTNQIELIMDSATGTMWSFVVDVGGFVPAYELDVGARLAAPVTSCPVYLRETRALTWTEMGGGAGLDFVVASIDVAPREGAPWRWRVLAPASGDGLVLPAFPDELAAFQIEGLDFYAVQDVLRGTAAGGYPALVASGIWPTRDDGDYFLQQLAPLGSFMLAQSEGCRPL